MQTARRRQTTWAIAASVLAHVAVLVVALLQRPTLPLPIDETGPPEPIIPVLLLPRTPPPLAAARAAQPSDVRLHHRVQRQDESALPIAPLPAEPGPSRPPPTAPTSESASPATRAPAGPPEPDLGLSLRHGLAGCANGGASLSRADRERCEEQLGHDMASASFMPAAIPPRIRTYYDAVALAKQRDPPHVAVVNKAPLPLDPPPRRPGGDHPPGIGCSIPFGPGVKRPKKERLPHALWLGPCFIEPPKGSLTPEVDLTPP